VNDYDIPSRKWGLSRYTPNGHSYTGVNFSIHSNYSRRLENMSGRMIVTYGEDRNPRPILSEVTAQFTVYYPSLTIKGAIQNHPALARPRLPWTGPSSRVGPGSGSSVRQKRLLRGPYRHILPS